MKKTQPTTQFCSCSKRMLEVGNKINILSSVAINTWKKEARQNRPLFVLVSIVLTTQEKRKEKE